jgi:hypothetical protein
MARKWPAAWRQSREITYFISGRIGGVLTRLFDSIDSPAVCKHYVGSRWNKLLWRSQLAEIARGRLYGLLRYSKLMAISIVPRIMITMKLYFSSKCGGAYAKSMIANQYIIEMCSLTNNDDVIMSRNHLRGNNPCSDMMHIAMSKSYYSLLVYGINWRISKHARNRAKINYM